LLSETPLLITDFYDKTGALALTKRYLQGFRLSESRLPEFRLPECRLPECRQRK